jgi:hypothetical protein
VGSSLRQIVPTRAQSAEDFERDARLRRFIADCLALKCRPAFIFRRVKQEFSLPWNEKTFGFFLRHKVTQEDIDDALARLETGEIRATVRVEGGKTRYYVEPDRRLEYAKPVALDPRRSLGGQLRGMRSFRRQLDAALDNLTVAMEEAEEAKSAGELDVPHIERCVEGFRTIMQAIYPVVGASSVDIKDREIRLGVLGALAFDDAVPPKDRVAAVQVASRIVGDFQKARENEHDLNLKEMADRVVRQAMDRYQITREEAIAGLAEECPEIVGWLKIEATGKRA